jgi:hypothetical protein
MLLSPLTFRRVGRPKVPSLLSQQLCSHSVTRIEQKKSHVCSRAVFDDGVVASPDAGFHLPKVASKPRCKSADAVTRSTIHLSSGNYAPVTPSLLQVGIRNPYCDVMEDSADASVPAIKGIPATLVAGRFMHPGCPKGVKTGEDAVNYFAANQLHGKNNLFMYCNLRKQNSELYDPYDLVVCEANAIDPEYFIISTSGVCHIRSDGGGNTVTPLHTWASEARLFRMLKQMTFYKKFTMVKAWVTWKLKHKEGKFARRARFLQNKHPMLNEWFGDTMREIYFMVRPGDTYSASGEKTAFLCSVPFKH